MLLDAAALAQRALRLVALHEYDGEPWAADIGAHPGMRRVYVPHALVWLSRGSAEDEARARTYVAEGRGWDIESQRHVYTYPPDEPDPLGRAKRDVMEETRC